MSHTPGPWKAVGYSSSWEIMGPTPINGKTPVVVCYVEGGRSGSEINTANAHLIAVAPDLLEACKKIILHWHQGDLHPIDYQRIEQAIYKAEGKEKP